MCSPSAASCHSRVRPVCSPLYQQNFPRPHRDVRASTLHIHAVESLFKSSEAVLYNTGRLPALRSQQRATPPLSPNGMAPGVVAIILAMQP
jgi:hypothetical protein